ncbi:hypothetical protein FQN60_005188, partial [Etheostoma spectabile]
MSSYKTRFTEANPETKNHFWGPSRLRGVNTHDHRECRHSYHPAPTEVLDPPATQAGAVHGTAPVLVDQNYYQCERRESVFRDRSDPLAFPDEYLHERYRFSGDGIRLNQAIAEASIDSHPPVFAEMYTQATEDTIVSFLPLSTPFSLPPSLPLLLPANSMSHSRIRIVHRGAPRFTVVSSDSSGRDKVLMLGLKVTAPVLQPHSWGARDPSPHGIPRAAPKEGGSKTA